MSGLDKIYSNLSGEANFQCYERYLQIKIQGDGLGHFLANCFARDDLGFEGHELKFSIEFDQSEVHAMTRMVTQLLQELSFKDMGQIKKYSGTK